MVSKMFLFVQCEKCLINDDSMEKVPFYCCSFIHWTRINWATFSMVQNQFEGTSAILKNILIVTRYAAYFDEYYLSRSSTPCYFMGTGTSLMLQQCLITKKLYHCQSSYYGVGWPLSEREDFLKLIISHLEQRVTLHNLFCVRELWKVSLFISNLAFCFVNWKRRNEQVKRASLVNMWHRKFNELSWKMRKSGEIFPPLSFFASQSRPSDLVSPFDMFSILEDDAGRESCSHGVSHYISPCIQGAHKASHIFIHYHFPFFAVTRIVHHCDMKLKTWRE